MLCEQRVCVWVCLLVAIRAATPQSCLNSFSTKTTISATKPTTTGHSQSERKRPTVQKRKRKGNWSEKTESEIAPFIADPPRYLKTTSSTHNYCLSQSEYWDWHYVSLESCLLYVMSQVACMSWVMSLICHETCLWHVMSHVFYISWVMSLTFHKSCLLYERQ